MNFILTNFGKNVPPKCFGVTKFVTFVTLAREPSEANHFANKMNVLVKHIIIGCCWFSTDYKRDLMICFGHIDHLSATPISYLKMLKEVADSRWVMLNLLYRGIDTKSTQ